MATATESSSSSSDGPVLSVISKRIRALRKKYNRIVQMEEALASGKALNKEQEEVLKSKPVVTALIDELEKLRSPLAAAVTEELQQHHQPQQQSEEQKPKQLDRSAAAAGDQDELIEDLLRLVYFGSLFDVRSQAEFTAMMLTRSHERGCCLTYDYVTDDVVDLLSEKDLNLISVLGSLVTSRPVNEVISHKSALEACIDHAKRWISGSDQPINPETAATYAGLKEKLKKIISSDFFTATPEMKAPVEVAAAVGQLHISEGSTVQSETAEGDIADPDNKVMEPKPLVEVENTNGKESEPLVSTQKVNGRITEASVGAENINGQKKSELKIRQLEKTDYAKGFVELLRQLSTCPSLSKSQFEARFAELAALGDDHHIAVAEDAESGRIVATGSVFMEKKFLRNCSSVAHIEDVVVDKTTRGAHLGQRIVSYLVERARDAGCYKVILDCAPEVRRFYEKCGFVEKNVQMAMYF